MRVLPIALFVAAAGPATGRTWNVNPDQTGDAPTIAAALDSAAAGDTVVAECGTYLENTFHLKSGVTLTGGRGELDCVVIRFTGGLRSIGVTGAEVRGVTFDPRSGSVAAWIEDSEVALRSCRLSGWNPALWAWRSAITVEDCVFELNGDHVDGGGGIRLVEGSVATVRGCKFWENGGAIFCDDGGQATIEGCFFESNHWHDIHGPPTNYAAGVYCRGQATIRDCVFADNLGESGGAVSGIGGTVEITGCSFWLNYGHKGAGVCMIDGDLTMRDCTVQGNESSHGALAFYGSTATIEDCLVTGNLGNWTGAAHIEGSSVAFRRCTIVENTGQRRDQNIAGLRLLASTVLVEDSIVRNACGVADIHVAAGTTLTATCSILDRSRMNRLGTFVDDGSNLDADPRFCGPDPCGEASMDGDYSLVSNSPCLPENNSCGVLIGSAGEGCPATAVEKTTWADIKSRYRTGH
jgi:hypothetical protein